MNLSTYIGQHQTIRGEINIINNLINKGNIVEDAMEIALHINLLAGKLNIHLSLEDKYLYPDLQKRNEEKLKEIADGYKREMSGLFDAFNEYKIKFNTKTKIIEQKELFIAHTKRIVNQIIRRMEKEEKELYTQI